MEDQLLIRVILLAITEKGAWLSDNEIVKKAKNGLNRKPSEDDCYVLLRKAHEFLSNGGLKKRPGIYFIFEKGEYFVTKNLSAATSMFNFKHFMGIQFFDEIQTIMINQNALFLADDSYRMLRTLARNSDQPTPRLKLKDIYQSWNPDYSVKVEQGVLESSLTNRILALPKTLKSKLASEYNIEFPQKGFYRLVESQN